MTLDEMIETKLANGDYASGSTDAYKNERDVIVDILSSPAVHELTIAEINGLHLHKSLAVRLAAQKASAMMRGIKLDANGNVALDYPVTELEREMMVAMPGR
jgi:hypothetical protein